MPHLEPPQNPAGEYLAIDRPSADERALLIAEIVDLPHRLRDAVAGLSDAQLDTRYRNWTIRQIVHHLADSHAHSYIRFKWALTEPTPRIKAYNEGDWSALADARTGDIAAALAMVEGVHAKWGQLLRLMTGADFDRAFEHPETNQLVPLGRALGYYTWHGRHHVSQIEWLRAAQSWEDRA
jgi:hypothetical protein